MSEKRRYLEPSQAQSEQPVSAQSDLQVPSSEQLPPPYEGDERGLFASTSAYPPAGQQPYPPGPYPPPQSQQPYPPQQPPPPQQYPQQPQYPQQQQYPQQPQYLQQQQYPQHQQSPAGNLEPIRLRLINPSRPQSGFSRATPERLHALARRPINTNKWTLFIEELNAALEKVPGSLANNVADFWVVSLVTLGMSAHARDMYADRQYNKVSEVVEKYNRAEFTAYGIVARFEMTRHEHHDSCEHSGNHSHCTHSDYAQHGFDRRNERYERRQQARRPEAVTLELVIERA